MLLIESTCFINAALNAFQLREVLHIASDGPVKVMHGVYDLRTNHVQSMPQLKPDAEYQSFLSEAPQDSAQLLDLAVNIAKVYGSLPDTASMTDVLMPTIPN